MTDRNSWVPRLNLIFGQLYEHCYWTSLYDVNSAQSREMLNLERMFSGELNVNWKMFNISGDRVLSLTKGRRNKKVIIVSMS